MDRERGKDGDMDIEKGKDWDMDREKDWAMDREIWIERGNDEPICKGKVWGPCYAWKQDWPVHFPTLNQGDGGTNFNIRKFCQVSIAMQNLIPNQIQPTTIFLSS